MKLLQNVHLLTLSSKFKLGKIILNIILYYYYYCHHHHHHHHQLLAGHRTGFRNIHTLFNSLLYRLFLYSFGKESVNFIHRSAANWLYYRVLKARCWSVSSASETTKFMFNSLSLSLSSVSVWPLLMNLFFVWMLLFLLLILKMKFSYKTGNWTKFFRSGLGLFESSCEHGHELPVYTKGGNIFH